MVSEGQFWMPANGSQLPSIKIFKTFATHFGKFINYGIYMGWGHQIYSIVGKRCDSPILILILISSVRDSIQPWGVLAQMRLFCDFALFKKTLNCLFPIWGFSLTTECSGQWEFSSYSGHNSLQCSTLVLFNPIVIVSLLNVHSFPLSSIRFKML